MCRHYQGSLDAIVLLQASPEQTKKQQEDADRAMENTHAKNRQGEQEPKERDGSEAGSELAVPQERKSGSGKAIPGQQLGQTAYDGDAAKVSTLLSAQGAQSFINYQDALGRTPLIMAASGGHAAVTKHLIAARCKVDLQREDGSTPLHDAAFLGFEAVTKQLLAARCNVDLRNINGATALQVAEGQGHAGIAALIRNRKQETPLLGRRVVINGLVARPELNGRTGTAVRFDDDKGRYSVELDDTSSSFMIKPCNLLPMLASPEKKTKKQQEDADRAIKELLEQAALKDEVEVEEERVKAEEKKTMIQEEERNVHEKARMMIEEEERKKWEEVLAAPTAGSTTALGPAAVPEEAPAPAEGMSRAAPAAGGAGPRYTYQSLSIATNNFEKRLGGGGCGSVFQGVLASGTRVAVKRLELGVAAGAGAAGLSMTDQMRTEVEVLSQVQHVNIVPLLGSSKDGMAPCLVYALMEGGSLQDRLACRGSGALVPLTANERIVVLSGVVRGLAYLHSEVRVIHRDVKSANVLLDRGCQARIGDFGIARSLNDNHSGITSTHMHTEHVIGTHVYMAPEYKKGELSTKVDAFAFGLVVLETLTGYAVCSPAPGHRNLLSTFDQELDTAIKLLAHLDRRACWDQHKQERIGRLHSIAERCLEARRKRRPELVELIPELEEVRRGTEALQALEAERAVGPLVEAEAVEKECCIYLKAEEVGYLLALVPCGHRCVCDECSALVVGRTCPVCRTKARQAIRVFD